MADIRAYQPAFTAGELSPALHARIDLAKYASGLKTARNLFIHPHGGASNRPGLEFLGEVKDSADRARLIPFQFNTEQTYVLEFGDLYMRVWKDGGIILSGSLPYELVTPYAHTAVGEIVICQEADVMYLCHPDHAVHKLERLAEDNWTLTEVTFAPSIMPPTGVAAFRGVSDNQDDPDYLETTYRYKVSAVSDGGEESPPSAEASCQNDLKFAGNTNIISWPALSGAARYIVYKYDGGSFGYIGGTDGLEFTDQNIAPDLADSPQTARNPFVGAGNYPRCATFIEQRLAFASSKNEPQAVWMSQSGNYENFGYSTPVAKASDAVTFRIRARQLNEIRALLPVKGLMLLTSGSEWLVSGGSNSDAITPSAIRIDNQGYRGAARVQPVVVGNVVLFPQARGGVIRDFSYDFTVDGFVGNDLTIMARHLFKGREIVAWAYAQAPNSIVWVVLDDGSLVSLTYMKEHDVWGWTRQDSAAGAVFEDVAVIAEGSEDVPYFIVRRTIGGTTRRYLERLHSREFEEVEDAFFVDCGLTYTGAPVATFSGLGHLEGQEVVALADGNVARNLTVAGGSVTLPFAASKVHIGLPYEAMLETLDLDLGSVRGLGTVQGRMKSIAEVTLRVEDTRGIFVGPYDDERDGKHLVEYRQRATEAWNEAIQLYTGDLRITTPWDWNTHGNVVVKQFDPLPMSILAIMPDVTLGR